MARTTTATTIRIPERALKKGVVLLDLEEYHELKRNTVPTYYLSGKRARALDKLVEQGLKEHREGKTIKAASLKEALHLYEKRG